LIFYKIFTGFDFVDFEFYPDFTFYKKFSNKIFEVFIREYEKCIGFDDGAQTQPGAIVPQPVKGGRIRKTHLIMSTLHLFIKNVRK
jgi:hypothetical protein